MESFFVCRSIFLTESTSSDFIYIFTILYVNIISFLLLSSRRLCATEIRQPQRQPIGREDSEPVDFNSAYVAKSPCIRNIIILVIL